MRIPGELREEMERDYQEWEKTEMDLRAEPDSYWHVSDQRSAWETYGDSRIWYQTGAE